jgi:hypothetical protein
MKLKTFDILMNGKLRPFEVVLDKGTKVLDFIDHTGESTVQLVILEPENMGDELETRKLCFYQVNDKETNVPELARYIATSKGKYWAPFMLFDVTGCVLDEEE